MKRSVFFLLLWVLVFSLNAEDAGGVDAAEAGNAVAVAEGVDVGDAVAVAEGDENAETGDSGSVAESESIIESLDYISIEESKETCIVIESNIPKTQIYLNGIFYGKTNLVVKDLLPGQYVLKVQAASYKSQTFFIEVRRNYRLTYRVNLHK